MRTAFIKQLTQEAEKNDRIFLIVGDLGYSVVEEFRDKFPDRFLNAGIAEQNMAGVAAGLAMEGYNVYIYSIANFPTLRCMEQLRYDIAYHHLNVKIVSIGAGYAYGSLGASHHATEDLGMMRCIPDMIVCTPGDPVEAQVATRFSASYDGPMYFRLGKAGETIVHQKPIETIQAGDILPVLNHPDANTAVLTCGSILNYAKTYILEHNLPTDLYSLLFIKPLNKMTLANIAQRYQKIVVLEEHQKSCGAGSAVIEIMNDLYCDGILKTYPTIKRIAIDDRFISVSGSQQYLREQAGLSLDGILD